MIQFCENFAWFPVNTCDAVCEEDLKHFHTSLLGNEEDPKGLPNIKQEFLSHYLLHLYMYIVARMWQVVSLEKRRSGNESLLAIWFLRTMSYKQTRLAPVCYKDSGLKVLFTFQVWARLFYRCMYFFVFVFSYLLYGCVPCHTERYQTHSTSKIRTLFWLHKLAT